MPWFKVDDGLSSKAETTRIPRAHRTSAIGLWVLAGAWCAKELTDGHVPAHMVEELAGSDDDAQWLVKAGYWITVEDGFQFASWAPDQPLRETVIAAREKNAAKVKDWRSRNQPRNPVTPAVTNSDVTLPPSHPDPTQTTSNEVHVQPSVGRVAQSGYSPEFEEFWSEYPRREGKGDAYKAFTAAMKLTDLQTLLRAVRAYKLAKMTDDKSKIKMAGGWLRDRRWEDDVVTTGSAVTTQRNADAWMNQSLALVPSFQGSGPAAPRGNCSEHPDYPLPCDRCERDQSFGELIVLENGTRF